MKKETDWVNVHDDELMVSLGFRQPPLTPRDPNVWTKTDAEKKRLANLKARIKGKFRAQWGYTAPEIPVYGKLIVYIKKDPKYTIIDPKTKKKVFKTTFSYKCGQSRIPRILATFNQVKINKITNTPVKSTLVTKYCWNGRTYSPSELPYWAW